MKIIAGLGNPGSRYADTRHNIGFLAVDRLAEAAGIKIRQNKYLAEVGTGSWEGCRIMLLKPQTYMNLSGDSVKSALVANGAKASDLIVIHDDIDLAPGSIRIKEKGGHGGHNGIRSIMAVLGTDEFIRIKIGVGRPDKGGDTAGYVLRPFAKEEKQVVEEALQRAEDAVRMVLAGELVGAMNRFHAL
ncbi:MAG: aminoacyl-tRNA hydrolase [Nitrospirota bacterium]|nr:aminoacyl-tRNA hydrolase [Nitrospirota bacterium]